MQHQSGVSDIMTQRDRIHDQIKNIRIHYMSERSHYIDQLRSVNSRQQRERLISKFLNKLQEKGRGSQMGSMVGRGESRLGIISEHESYIQNINYQSESISPMKNPISMPQLGRLELNKSNLSRLDESMTTKNKKVPKNHPVLAEETAREVSSNI